MGGLGVAVDPTFVLESKTDKIPKSQVEGGVEGRGGGRGSLPTESFVTDLLCTDVIRSTTIWQGTID